MKLHIRGPYTPEATARWLAIWGDEWMAVDEIELDSSYTLAPTELLEQARDALDQYVDGDICPSPDCLAGGRAALKALEAHLKGGGDGQES